MVNVGLEGGITSKEVPVKGIVFDMHGVLVFAFPSKRYQKKISKCFPPEDFEKLKKEYKTGAMVFAMHGKKKEYADMLNSLPICHRKEKGIIRVLEKMRGKVKFYVITDTAKVNCIKSLEGAGYDLSMFTEIVTLEDVIYPKPALEGYQRIGAGEGFIVFGDNHSDIEPAETLGAKGIIINSRREIIRHLNAIAKMLQ
jgi:FMN phosphatase YigB (HAD superfamily)